MKGDSVKLKMYFHPFMTFLDNVYNLHQKPVQETQACISKDTPKEAAFLVRIFHVFLWTCSKLEHWCY